FSRGGLVDNAALKSALEVGLLSVYVTDFPDAEVLEMENVISIPHLGASSAESEDNCAVMAAEELIEYMENGNIINSVNFPNCELPRATENRVTILHKNVPNMLSQFSNAFAAKGINIENMMNKSKGDYAYTIMDVCGEADALAGDIAGIDGVIKVRVIK
ncbi:MAG: 3-phosphoglycerate dehydrogenase, partial [Oscillospiraceae bacterium]|nr:3-phosphoglycerate dehydrogenase [Oscillospiraceae bacterium]